MGPPGRFIVLNDRREKNVSRIESEHCIGLSSQINQLTQRLATKPSSLTEILSMQWHIVKLRPSIYPSHLDADQSIGWSSTLSIRGYVDSDLDGDIVYQDDGAYDDSVRSLQEFSLLSGAPKGRSKSRVPSITNFYTGMPSLSRSAPLRVGDNYRPREHYPRR